MASFLVSHFHHHSSYFPVSAVQRIPMRLSLQCTITVNNNSNKSKEQILPMVIHGLHCKFHPNLHSPSRAVTWYNKTYKILHLWIVTLVHHFYSDDLSPLVLSTRGYCNQCHGVCIAISCGTLQKHTRHCKARLRYSNTKQKSRSLLKTRRNLPLSSYLRWSLTTWNSKE